MKARFERWARTVIAALALTWPLEHAWADGLELDIANPRAVGRAGAVVVSDDSGAALFVNPAAMARREQWRAQLGILIVDQELGFRALDEDQATGGPGGPGEPSGPLIEDRGAPTSTPQLAVQGRIGPLLVGIAYLEGASSSQRLPGVRASSVPVTEAAAAEINERYPYRYLGTEFSYHRRALFVGAAVRVRPWLALGVSLGAARVTVAETRHLWAGFAERDDVGVAERDLILGLEATDALVPRMTAGMLLAPLHAPVEMALSVSYAANADAQGEVSMRSLYDISPVAAALSEPSARIALAQPLIVRTGVRYLGERMSFEVGGDIIAYRERAPDWAITGVTVYDTSSARVELTSAPTLARPRSHAAVRLAADYDVIPGFLWLSTGYSYSSGATESLKLAPVFTSLPGHTLALGVEGHWSGMSLIVGYARTLEANARADLPVGQIHNPFAAGSAPVGRGRYQSARDRVGVALEIAWE